MKRETIYAVLAGCVFFCLVFYASFRYFSPPERPIGAAKEGGSAPIKAVDAIPADVRVPASLPPPDPGKNSAPVSAPPVAAKPLRSTPTAYGVAAGMAPSQASSPSNAAQRSSVRPQIRQEEMKAAKGWKERRKLQLEQRSRSTEED
jgi:hypothetical protein